MSELNHPMIAQHCMQSLQQIKKSLNITNIWVESDQEVWKNETEEAIQLLH